MQVPEGGGGRRIIPVSKVQIQRTNAGDTPDKGGCAVAPDIKLAPLCMLFRGQLMPQWGQQHDGPQGQSRDDGFQER
jgi:hypothetical protein